MGNRAANSQQDSNAGDQRSGHSPTTLTIISASPAPRTLEACERELARYLPFLSTTKVLMAAVRHGVGREVARVLVGEHSALLYPFRFERFATGDLHPQSLAV